MLVKSDLTVANPPYKDGALTLPPNIGEVWSDKDLAKVGLYRPIVDQVPENRVAVGWEIQRGTDGRPHSVPILEPLKDTLKKYAADLKWQKEVGGVMVNGVLVDTSDRSKVLIAGARMRAQSDPTVIEEFEAADGQTVTLDANSVIAISDAVGAHVSACFKKFAAVKAAIDSGEITTISQIDEAFSNLSALGS